MTHRSKEQSQEEVIKCKYCGDQFSAIWNLMSHRKQAHRNKVAFCKNKREDKCKFSSETCWWNHEKENTVQNLRILFSFL